MTDIMRYRRKIGIAFTTLGLGGLLTGTAMAAAAQQTGLGLVYSIVGALVTLAAFAMAAGGVVALVRSTKP